MIFYTCYLKRYRGELLLGARKGLQYRLVDLPTLPGLVGTIPDWPYRWHLTRSHIEHLLSHYASDRGLIEYSVQSRQVRIWLDADHQLAISEVRPRRIIHTDIPRPTLQTARAMSRAWCLPLQIMEPQRERARR